MTVQSNRIESGVDLDALPIRQGWESWDFTGDYEGTVQCYREHGDYGVIGNPRNGRFWVVFASDGVEALHDTADTAEEAMDAADWESENHPVPEEKLVR